MVAPSTGQKHQAEMDVPGAVKSEKRAKIDIPVVKTEPAPITNYKVENIKGVMTVDLTEDD